MKTKEEIAQRLLRSIQSADPNVVRDPSMADRIILDLYNTCQLLITELQKDSRWTPVSERLPEVDVEVLITDGHDVIQAFFHGEYWKGSVIVTSSMNDGFVSDRRIVQQGGNFDYITHWMPLPEPPKTENA